MSVRENARALLPENHEGWDCDGSASICDSRVQAIRDLLALLDEVTQEPEWEHGWRDERPIKWVTGANVAAATAVTVYPYEINQHAVRVRRRRAGAWEPVPEKSE